MSELQERYLPPSPSTSPPTRDEIEDIMDLIVRMLDYYGSDVQESLQMVLQYQQVLFNRTSEFRNAHGDATAYRRFCQDQDRKLSLSDDAFALQWSNASLQLEHQHFVVENTIAELRQMCSEQGFVTYQEDDASTQRDTDTESAVSEGDPEFDEDAVAAVLRMNAVAEHITVDRQMNASPPGVFDAFQMNAWLEINEQAILGAETSLVHDADSSSSRAISESD